jgi:hypothetical protein
MQMRQTSPSANVTQVATPTASVATSQRKWVIDSGASHHITSTLGILSDYVARSDILYVKIANGDYAGVLGRNNTGYLDHYFASCFTYA